MARTLFCQSTSGTLSPRGTLVSSIQTALNAALGGQPIKVDGDFGGQTKAAVTQFQTARGLLPTGIVTDQTWQALMNSNAPPMFERCLQITATFEGTGYTRVVGNFDGAGITWGIIGFTLMGGELGKILADINAAVPTAIANAFGANAAQLMRICGPSSGSGEKLAFANSVSTGPNRGGVIEPWKTAFRLLGEDSAIQALQTKRARDIYWTKAVRDAASLAMQEELDYALLYDVSVQNGGLGSGLLADIRAAFDAEHPATAQAKRLVVSRLVAAASNPQFQGDVRLRKDCLSTGQGGVHGDTFKLADWGLLDGMAGSVS